MRNSPPLLDVQRLLHCPYHPDRDLQTTISRNRKDFVHNRVAGLTFEFQSHFFSLTVSLTNEYSVAKIKFSVHMSNGLTLTMLSGLTAVGEHINIYV